MYNFDNTEFIIMKFPSNLLQVTVPSRVELSHAGNEGERFRGREMMFAAGLRDRMLPRD